MKPTIGLFAISIMHNSIIDIGNGSKITLTASYDTSSMGDIGILSAAPVLLLRARTPLPPGTAASMMPGSPERVVMLSTAMFITGMKATAHCTAELLAATQPWNMALEITSDMRLGILA
jgi:hypothetical protein